MERLEPPGLHLVHVALEGGPVELAHVEAARLQLARLLVEDPSELHRQPPPVAVVLVGERVDDRHRSGHGELELFRRVGAREGDIVNMRRPTEHEWPGYRGHNGIVAM